MNLRLVTSTLTWLGRTAQLNTAMGRVPSVKYRNDNLDPCFGCRALVLALLVVETASEDRWGFLSRPFSQMDQLQRMEDLKKVGKSLFFPQLSSMVASFGCMGICSFAGHEMNDIAAQAVDLGVQ